MKNEFLSSEALFKRVEEIRNSRGWSVYELAKRAGISETSIYNWRDRDSSPTLYLLENICEALEISIIQLFIDQDKLVDLTQEQEDLVKRWTGLKEQQKRAILEMIKAFELNS